MTLQTIVVLVLIGLFAGIASGFVGVGGGIVIVPALVYMLGLSQHNAQGTSLLIMLPPVGILAVMNYYKAGELNISYGIVIACTMVLGGWIGSKLALKISPATVKLVFGVIMLYVAIRMVYVGYRDTFVKNEINTTTESQENL